MFEKRSEEAFSSAGANGLLLNLRTLVSDVSLFGADPLGYRGCVCLRKGARGPAPQREPMSLCLPVFDYLTQSSLSLRAFRIGCLPLSEQTPSAPNIECRFINSRGGLPLSGNQWACACLLPSASLTCSFAKAISFSLVSNTKIFMLCFHHFEGNFHGKFIP